MKIGVIGVGVISTSVVKALQAKYGDAATFFLSPRNAQKSAALRDRYDNIAVMKSNQEVVDRSDIVILAILPQVAMEVVTSLSFSPEQHVISLVSVPKLALLAEWIGHCKSITRVVPLTFIERHIGPVMVYPPTPLVRDLLDGLGEVIVFDDEQSFIQMQTLSAAMGPFYYLADAMVSWTAGHGQSKEAAAAYLFAMFKALADEGGRKEASRIAELWEEMTPGGLNEDAIKTIREGGGFSLWTQALEKIYQRVR